MAKKKEQVKELRSRASRREELIRRKEEAQMRNVRLGVGIVVGLVLLVIVGGLVTEFIVMPNRTVATVRGETISLREFQERVRFERAQRIVALEEQFDLLDGNVGLIQQFGGQVINELFEPEIMGQNALDLMTNEIAIRQEAESRGIMVTEAEIDEEIGRSFNYFGGESPTVTPEPTATIMPTPSLTPIPTAVITEVVEVETPLPVPTQDPNATPFPTPTAVSEEFFQEELSSLVADFSELGISEAQFRESVRNLIYRRKLQDALAEEAELVNEAEQASFYLMTFQTEEDANEALALIAESDYLTVWNTLRSTPLDAETPAIGTATEVLWQTEEALRGGQNALISEAAFSLPVGETSELLVEEINEETTRYYLVQVSGREVRPQSNAVFENEKAQFLVNSIEQLLVGQVETNEFWRDRIPTVPVLDQKFLQPPTPAPEVPAVDPVLPEVEE